MKIKIFGIFLLTLLIISSGLANEDPKETELLFMAKKAYEDGFYEVSLGMLERFQKNYKDSAKIPQAILLSAECYFYQGRYLEALNIFESLAASPQANNFKDELYFWMGEVHFKGGNFQKAALLYQKLLDDYPQSAFAPAAYYSLGWANAQLGKLDAAILAFKSLMEKFPQEPQSKDAAFKLIECLYNLKEYSELKIRIIPVVKLYAKDSLRLPYLYFYLAESEYYLGNLDQAVSGYLKSAQTSKEPKVYALAQLGLGWSYLKLAKYKEAEEVFASIKSNSLDKKSLEIHILGSAVLMSATNRVYEAMKLYEQLINQSADPLFLLQGYLGKADAHYNLAEYAQAAKIYKEGLDKIEQAELIDELPKELIDKLRYNLVLAYIKQGKIKASVELFEGIIQGSGEAQARINLLLKIGQAYTEALAFKNAEEVYAMTIKLFGDYPNADYAQYQIANLQLKRSAYADAVASLNLLFKKYPQSNYFADGLYTLGLTYFQQADYLKSCEIFGRFKNEFKDSLLRPQALYMLGRSLIDLEKFNEALVIFKDLAKSDLLETDLLQRSEYEIADCYFKLGQENEAVNRFKLLRAKYPNARLAPDILWWLGQHYYRIKDLDLARRYLNSLAKDFPDSSLAANAFYVLGLISSDENKFDQAQDYFRVAIKIGNDDLGAQAMMSLADSFSRAGKPEEALAQYKELIKRNPDLGGLLYARVAGAYYKVGDYAQAKALYFKSLADGALLEAASIRFNLAETLEANAEPEAAIQQYLLVANLNSGSPELSVRAWLRAAKIYEDQENFKEALKIYQIVVEKKVEESGFAREKADWIISQKRR